LSVYGSEKERWRILANKEICAVVKKTTITETVRLHRLCCFGQYRKWKKIELPKEY